MLSTPIELCLFGVPHLKRGEQRLHVGARKALALLALLAVDGQTLRERLAATLWPDHGPQAALRNLRQEIFRLRQLGAAPQTAAERALMLPAALRVDVLQFRQALAEHDDALALRLSAATAFEGFDGLAGREFDAWLAAARNQLLEERQAARERLAEALEARGDLEGALALARQTLAEDGCAENAACMAMRLLVGLGERAAAAALFARLRRSMQEELDSAPDARTLALAARLRLVTDAAGPMPLRPATPVPAQADGRLPERFPFVGREAEQRLIDAACTAGKRVYLSGVAGSGKTRLAAACAAARGAWLQVGCAPTDAGVPFASALRVLRALREAAGEPDLPPWVRRELAWLMPELGEGPAPVPGAEAGERLRDAFAAAWRLLAADNFSVIVLDDWHWADDASVELWQRVEGGGAASIVVFRSAQLSTAALARMHEEVDGGRAVAVEIGGLCAAETLALVQAASGSSEGQRFADRLHLATAGNPFFLIETLRHLVEQGQLRSSPGGRWVTAHDRTTADYAELPVPPTVREVVLGRVRAQGEPTRRVLEAASLLGDRFDVAAVQDLVDAETLVALLEHAQAARLIFADGDRYRFAHELIRQCLADSLSLARRRLLHAKLAQRLAAMNAEPALVAAQYEGAQQHDRAVTWRCRAAEAAWRAHALTETRQHYRQALADGADGRVAAEIHAALAEVERHAGGGEPFMAALQRATEVAREAGDAAHLDARLTQLRHWTNSRRCVDVLAALDALEVDLGRAAVELRARAAMVRSLALHYSGRIEEGRRCGDQAVELLADTPGALALRSEMLDAAARLALGEGELERAIAMGERAVAAAEAAGDRLALAQCLTVLGIALLHGRNERAAAAAAFERSRVLGRELGHVPRQRTAILNLVKIHTDAGRWAEAQALLDEGQALAPGYEHPSAQQAFMEARYFVAYLRGELTTARAAALELIEMTRGSDAAEDLPAACQLVVDLFLHTGDLATARRVLDAAGTGGAFALRAALAAKRAWLELAAGHAQHALAALDGCAAPTRVEDGLLFAWVGAAAALALGDAAGARRRLDAVDIGADHVTDALAMVLVQRLRLAHASGQPDAAARERALALLPLAPALEAALLRTALQSGSTPFERPRPAS